MGGKKPKQMSRAQLMKKLTPAQRAKLTKLVERQKATEARENAAADAVDRANDFIDKLVDNLRKLEEKAERALDRDDAAYKALEEYEDFLRDLVRPAPFPTEKPLRGKIGKQSRGRKGGKGWKGGKAVNRMR